MIKLWIELREWGTSVLVCLDTGAEIYVQTLANRIGDVCGADILLRRPNSEIRILQHFSSREKARAELEKIRDAIKFGANYFEVGGD